MKATETATIKSKADKIQTLSDIPVGTLLHKIAGAMIKFHGYYTYTEIGTNRKCFVS